jgi:predicted DNA-binding transcriptional regulator AlpA
VSHVVVEAEELITIERVARSLHVGITSIKRMDERGDFPPHVPLPLRRYLYRRSDLDAYWKTRLGGQNGSRFPLAPEEPGDK